MFGFLCWGLSLPAPVAGGERLTANNKMALVQSASYSLVDGLQRVQEHFDGKVMFAHISRHQEQGVYKIGIVVDEKLKIVLFNPHSGKILAVNSAEKFWHWKRFFSSKEEEQFLQTPTDLLKAIQRVLDQQRGVVIGAFFKLEEGVHFYRVVLWADQKKQMWIVDSDTEVAFLAKKNHE